MITKIFKAVWFFSMLATLGVLLYVYASLQEMVVLSDGQTGYSVPKEYFFYALLAGITFLNFAVFFVSSYASTKSSALLAWFYGLVACCNFFIVIGLSFINLYNSGERFDYDRIGFVVYGSLGLIVIWIISWPIFRASRFFLSKS